MKKVLFTLFLAMLMLCSVLFVASCDKKETPPPTKEELLEQAFDISFAPKGENAQKLSTIVEEAFKAGSVELKVESLSDLEIIPFIDDISIKSYVADGKEALVISCKDADGNNGSIIAYADNDKIVLSSPAVENGYGITYDELYELLSVDAPSNTPNIDTEKLTKLLNDYSDYIKATIEKYSSLVLNETEAGYTFNYVISNENVHSIFTDLLNKVKADSELGALIDGLELDVTFEDICKGIDEALAELPNVGGELTFVVNTDKEYKITSIELTLKADLNEDEDAATINLEEVISIKFVVEENKDTLSVTAEDFSFAIVSAKEDTLTNYKQAISVEVNMPDDLGNSSKVTLDILSIELNKLTKDYSVKLNIPQALSATVTGKLDISDEKLTLSITDVNVTSIDGLGSTTKTDIPVNATLIINKADTMPNAPASFKDISKLTENEIEALMTELYEDPFFANIIELFMVQSEPVGPDYEY